jgi:hypothetical protein
MRKKRDSWRALVGAALRGVAVHIVSGEAFLPSMHNSSGLAATGKMVIGDLAIAFGDGIMPAVLLTGIVHEA